MHPVNSTLECTAESWNKFFGRIWKNAAQYVCALQLCHIVTFAFFFIIITIIPLLRIFVVVVVVAAVACNDATADTLKRFLLLLLPPFFCGLFHVL